MKDGTTGVMGGVQFRAYLWKEVGKCINRKEGVAERTRLFSAIGSLIARASADMHARSGRGARRIGPNGARTRIDLTLMATRKARRQDPFGRCQLHPGARRNLLPVLLACSPQPPPQCLVTNSLADLYLYVHLSVSPTTFAFAATLSKISFSFVSVHSQLIILIIKTIFRKFFEIISSHFCI